MHQLTTADYRIMPWKNGQGSTCELLIEPKNASLDDFDWRISRADIHADGAFSVFAGIDRSLLMMSGEGVDLKFHGQNTPVTLTPDSEPFVFSGDEQVFSSLLNGSVTDFNVMTRRSNSTHRLEKQAFNSTLNLTLNADTVLIYNAAGAKLTCTYNQQSLCLPQGELLVLSSQSESHFECSNILLEVSEQTTIYVVSINRIKESLNESK